MTEPMTNGPNAGWTDLQLLAEYNKFSPTKRRARFKTKDMAIKSIEQARSAQLHPNLEQPTPARPAKPKKIPGQKRSPKNVRARMAGLKIIILTEENPYRGEDDAGLRRASKAWEHYEKMRGGITVLEYLAKFTEQDQKNARQYLWNAINPPPTLVEETDPRTGRTKIIEVPTPPHVKTVE